MACCLNGVTIKFHSFIHSYLTTLVVLYAYTYLRTVCAVRFYTVYVLAGKPNSLHDSADGVEDGKCKYTPPMSCGFSFELSCIVIHAWQMD